VGHGKSTVLEVEGEYKLKTGIKGGGLLVKEILRLVS